MKNELIANDLNYKILNNINLKLDSGINALIGKSGSGKTTLLKSIAGLFNYNGNIFFNGETIEKNSTLNQIFGIYYDNINLNEDTVFNNLIEPLINLNNDLSSSKKTVYKISKELKIDNLLYKNIFELSYTQKKIISFAKSIIHEPKVILLDNLFDSFDLYYKNIIIDYLKKLVKENKAIILFTTNNSEDLMYADNIIILNSGKVVSNELKEKIFEKENLFIKNNCDLPFIVDLSHKLKSYELIDHIIYDYNELVDEIWK